MARCELKGCVGGEGGVYGRQQVALASPVKAASKQTLLQDNLGLDRAVVTLSLQGFMIFKSRLNDLYVPWIGGKKVSKHGNYRTYYLLTSATKGLVTDITYPGRLKPCEWNPFNTTKQTNKHNKKESRIFGCAYWLKLVVVVRKWGWYSEHNSYCTFLAAFRPLRIQLPTTIRL